MNKVLDHFNVANNYNVDDGNCDYAIYSTITMRNFDSIGDSETVS